MYRLLLPVVTVAGSAAAEVPKVATDIAPVHSIVAAVMKDLGSPSLIVQPGSSPHGYAMRPSEARALSEADVVVWIGHGLTPWLEEPIETLAPAAVHIELMDAEGIRLLEYREGALFEDHHDHDHGHGDHADHDDHAEDKHDDHDHEEHAEDKHDDHDHEEHAEDKHDDHDHEEHAEDKHDDHDHEEHAEDKHDDHDHEDHAEHKHDDHGHEEHAEHDDHDHDKHEEHAGHSDEGSDPHIWLDPMNAAAAAKAVAVALGEKDPANASKYVENAEAFSANLTQLSTQIGGQLTAVRGEPFIVFHDAFHYFEARFGIEASGSVSAGDAAKPGAARVAKIRAHTEKTGAVCAFAEPQMNTAVLETVVEGQPTTIATLDPLGASLELGADLYPQLIQDLANALSDCLKS